VIPGTRKLSQRKLPVLRTSAFFVFSLLRMNSQRFRDYLRCAPVIPGTGKLSQRKMPQPSDDVCFVIFCFLAYANEFATL
jgi:hypothetical protein